MPSWSGAGKRRPVSTTTMRPSYSITSMFLPISPRPPSGRTRRVALKTAGPMGGSSLDALEEAVCLQCRADLALLVL
jgi:hypothetical protein